MAEPDSPGGLRLAADIGGTFTDIAAFDPESGALRLGKALSTPAHLVDGIAAGVDRAGVAFSEAALFLHGSTIAINTMLERTGARAALVITKGFRDIYEIGRVNRPDSYNLFFKKHRPLIERAMCFELDERMLAEGEALRPLDEDEVRALGEKLAGLDVEAVAILLLHSYRNPDHEKRTKAILESCLPRAFVTASYELSQEYREFERCSTVAANAYIGPGVRRYLGEIGDRLEAESFPGAFLVVQSTGGLYDVAQGAARLRPHARIGARRGGHRGAGASPCHRDRERDHVRHGRNHGQVGGDPWRRGADHGKRQDRRLRAGPAGTDRDDGHIRGGHGRRFDRENRCAGRAPRGSGKRRRAPGARPATARAAPGRRLPTPTWCSAASPPTVSSAAQ